MPMYKPFRQAPTMINSYPKQEHQMNTRIARLTLWTSVLIIVMMATLNACKPGKPAVVLTDDQGQIVQRPPPPKPADEDAARALQVEASSADKSGDQITATEKTTQLLDMYPGTQAASDVFRDQLQKATASGDTRAALKNLEKLLFYRDDFSDIDALRRQYATLLVRAARYDEAAKFLRPLFDTAKDQGVRAELGAMLGQVLSHLRAGREALEIQVSLHKNLSGTERSKIETQAIDIVSSGLGFEEAEDLWNDVGNDSDWAFLHAVLAFKLAKIYYHVRDYEKSEKMLNLVVTRFGGSPYHAAAKTFLQRLQDRFKVRPRAIGVVLPLTGRFGRYGQQLLEAIKLNIKTSDGITIIAKDNEGDATKSVRAVESLVLEDHVMGIIGPLFPKPAMAAALKAEELSVPMLSLGYRAGIAEVGPHIFRTALTIGAQAKALAKVAFEDLGMTRFAMLYPQNPYGQEFVEAFWDEVEKRHGEIRGVESYEHDQTSFQLPVRKLVGRHFKYARYEYTNALARLRAKHLPSHRFQAALEKVTKNLPPAIDFDAIIIPDSAKNIGLVVPHILFEDVILTHDPKMLKAISRSTGNKNIKPVNLLGGSTWNSPETAKQCEAACDHAVFVDAYFPANPEPSALDFVSRFRNKMGTAPGLFEAQAYDTAGIVRNVLNAGKPTDRRAFRKLLSTLSTYKGVTGALRFDADGEVQRDLFTLTINEGEIRLWSAETAAPKG